MLGRQLLLGLAALCLPQASPAFGQATSSTTTLTVADTLDAAGADPCPVPDVLAASELALNCSKDVAAFLKRLRSEKACGSQDKYPIDQACAVILYSLDPEFVGQVDLPPIVTVRVGRITTSKDVATTITVIKNNGVAEQLPPERAYELLIPIRVDERVRVHPESGTGKRADQKVGLFQRGIRYYPALLIGRGEASLAMTPKAIKVHFTMPVQIMQNLARLLTYECMKFGRCS